MTGSTLPGFASRSCNEFVTKSRISSGIWNSEFATKISLKSWTAFFFFFLELMSNQSNQKRNYKKNRVCEFLYPLSNGLLASRKCPEQNTKKQDFFFRETNCKRKSDSLSFFLLLKSVWLFWHVTNSENVELEPQLTILEIIKQFRF